MRKDEREMQGSYIAGNSTPGGKTTMGLKGKERAKKRGGALLIIERKAGSPS